jgi:GntR family transcriptional regulator
MLSGVQTRPREQRAVRQRDAVRRLRDVLRSNVVHGGYADGRLPSENELMRAHRASRAVVREALAQLRQEGLIERVQGLGTYAMHHTVVTRMVETHGIERPSRTPGVWADGAQRPIVLDRSVVATPDAVAARFGVGARDEQRGAASAGARGTAVASGPDARCLRVEYVATVGGEAVGIATNYLRFPEAERVAEIPFESDFYALLDRGGLRVGASEFLIGCANADPLTADLLGVCVGDALVTMEQVIFDEAGRPYDIAFVATRADRFMLLSRAERPGFGARPSDRLRDHDEAAR